VKAVIAPRPSNRLLVGTSVIARRSYGFLPRLPVIARHRKIHSTRQFVEYDSDAQGFPQFTVNERRS
jgi:hypothetical protein